MFDPLDRVFALRQPCLLKPVTPGLLDGTGCVRSSVLTAIDRLLVAHVRDQEFQETMPPGRLNLSGNDRWLNTSAMQKAIRRGQQERAAQHCVAGLDLDRRHTFRRLATCALEDVCLGDLVLTASSLAIVGSSAAQQADDAPQIAAWLASKLAAAPKSRTACDLLSTVDYNLGLKRKKSALSRASEKELLAVCGSGNSEDEMLGLWLLAGTHRFQGVTMPRENVRPRQPLMAHLASSGMPLIFYYIADRAAARLSDAMFVSLLPIWKIVSRAPKFSVSQARLSTSPAIGAFAAEAYDLHTRAGKAALAQLYKQSKEISAGLDHLSPSQRRRALEFGLFVVEGRSAELQLATPETTRVANQACFRELAYCGVHEAAQQEDLLARINRSLPQLHILRAEVAHLR